MNESINTYGFVTGVIEYKDGRKEEISFKNTILLKGRKALASSLARSFEGEYKFYISRMIFGNGGTVGGSKKVVNTNRNGLFGDEVASKPVISSVDGNMPYQVTFTSVLRFDEPISGGTVKLNEMALQMSTGDLYSMVTFADLNKSPDMQITFNWRLSFV